jgi:hypothetical protein
MGGCFPACLCGWVGGWGVGGTIFVFLEICVCIACSVCPWGYKQALGVPCILGHACMFHASSMHACSTPPPCMRPLDSPDGPPPTPPPPPSQALTGWSHPSANASASSPTLRTLQSVTRRRGRPAHGSPRCRRCRYVCVARGPQCVSGWGAEMGKGPDGCRYLFRDSAPTWLPSFPPPLTEKMTHVKPLAARAAGLPVL